MKKTAILPFAVILSANVSSAQTAEQKARIEYVTPGKMHELLAKSDGAWDVEVKAFMPDGKTISKKRTCVNTMILGNRYLQSVVKGEVSGVPYEGIRTIGYNNKTKLFQFSLVETTATGITSLEGTWDEASRTINFTGNETDPLSDNKKPVHQELKIIDDYNQLMTIWTVKDGKEIKLAELKFTRASK